MGQVTPEAVEKAVRKHGSVNKAAAALGIARSHAQAKVAVARAGFVVAKPQMSFGPGFAIAVEAAVSAAMTRLLSAGVSTPAKPRVRVRAGSSRLAAPIVARVAVQPFGEHGPILRPMFGVHAQRRPNVVRPLSPERRLTIAKGDGHVTGASAEINRLTLRCHALVGFHVAARKPDVFVDMGDFSDWASVCHHVKNTQWKARLKPTIEQDLEAVRENLDALFRPIREAGVRPECVALDGNHERWLHDYEDANPETHGQNTGAYGRMLRDAGFSHHLGYGQHAFVGGVGYTHAPLNVMGRPFGGENAEANVAAKAVHDTVWAHTHLHSVGTRRKVGHQALIRSINTGSAMPPGYCGDHAIDTMGSYIDSGVLEVWDRDGRICDWRHVPMEILEDRYGRLADKLLGRLT